MSKVTVAQRCEHCGQRYVNLAAHTPKCRDDKAGRHVLHVMLNDADYSAVQAFAEANHVSGASAVRLLALHGLKDPPHVGNDALSRQQRAVYDMCAAGASNAEIEAALNISLNQVYVVINGIRDKGIEVPNRPKGERRRQKPMLNVVHHVRREESEREEPKTPWKPGDPKPDWLRRAGR